MGRPSDRQSRILDVLRCSAAPMTVAEVTKALGETDYQKVETNRTTLRVMAPTSARRGL